MHQEFLDLECALRTIRQFSKEIDKVYAEHDHDHDIVGGALISSIRLFCKAIEESIIAIQLHLERKINK